MTALCDSWTASYPSFSLAHLDATNRSIPQVFSAAGACRGSSLKAQSFGHDVDLKVFRFAFHTLPTLSAVDHSD